MTFETAKSVIKVQKERGTLDKDLMKHKVDVFYMNDRINEEELEILLNMIDSEER